jgi:uncharacterized protein involved in type VI secretion and phage assembly
MEGAQLERLVVDLAEQTRARFYGKYRGLVSSVQDPQGLGRIKARIPEVLGETESPWALPSIPYAGGKLGFHSIPPVGAGVWMEFEAGDVSRPIWSGCWWGKDDLPQDEKGGTASPALKIWRTEAGLLLSFDDDGKTITLSDGNGKNLVTLTTGDGGIRVQAAAKVVVEAPQIQLVDNAAHPLVFGDSLLQYLQQVVMIYQSHVHPGQMAAGVLPVTPAPPVPPMPPPSPSLLSTKVKTG